MRPTHGRYFGIDGSNEGVKMQIDERIEEKVREAYRGVVARDGDRVTAAFRDLGEDDSKAAVGLGLFACGYIVNDVYPDGPTEADLRELARQVVKAESSWIDLGNIDAVANFLGVAAKGDTSFSGVRAEDVTGLTFVCGGHLLATYREKDKHWWDYLDAIWAAAESASDPA
jgi:hypothetical protein